MSRSPKNHREEVQKKSLDFSIYELMLKEYSPADIVVNLNLSKQKVNYYTSKLEGLGLVRKVSYGIWEVLKSLSRTEFENLKKVSKSKKSKKFSLGTSDENLSDLHALQVKIPILHGVIDDKDWVVKEKLSNWIPKYTELDLLGGLKIKNNNNKSITVWAKQRKIKNVDEIHKLTQSILLVMGSYFKSKYDVQLDTINAQVKNLDIATEDKDAENMRGKGEKFLVNLGTKCEKILPKDDRDAQAWIDGTPFNFSAETNDLDWKREYLNMPFSIKDLRNGLPMLREYNENLKLHLEVQREQLKTQKELQRLLKKLNN